MSNSLNAYEIICKCVKFFLASGFYLYVFLDMTAQCAKNKGDNPEYIITKSQSGPFIVDNAFSSLVQKHHNCHSAGQVEKENYSS